MKFVRNVVIVLLVLALLYVMGVAFLTGIQGGHP